jgi:hypothetical protein
MEQWNKGGSSVAGSAGKDAAVCAPFISILGGGDGRNKLVSEEKGAVLLFGFPVRGAPHRRKQKD